MKKIIFLLAVGVLIFCGCSTLQERPKIKTWKLVGELPVPNGFNEQKGVAGSLAGVIGEYIIVAGGTNFPYKSVENGGEKVTYSDFYLMKQEGKEIKLIRHGDLLIETAYGTSISANDKIYYIGGTNKNGTSREIISLELSSDKTDIIVKKVGELPFEYYNGVAVLYEDDIYIVTGKQNNKLSKGFYKFSLKTKKTTPLKMFPGDARNQSVGQILNNGKENLLYVFGGGSSIAYTDGYAYSFKRDTWTKVKNVGIQNEDISLLGGSNIKLNDHRMLVIGGFNKDIWDEANLKLGTLKGEELKKYKKEYFNRKPKDYNWNKQMLVYNALNDEWKTIGEIPFLAPCGEALIRVGNIVYSINGEIKPGVRSKNIYRGIIE